MVTAVAAVDLGATSGRVMLGRVGPNEVSVEAVARFPNTPVRTIDGLHWNILELSTGTFSREITERTHTFKTRSHTRCPAIGRARRARASDSK